MSILFDLQQVFRPPLEDYDILIELDSELLPRHYQSVDTNVLLKLPKDNVSKRQVFPVVDFDPAALYLNELRVSGSFSVYLFLNTMQRRTLGSVGMDRVAKELRKRLPWRCEGVRKETTYL